MVNLNKIMQDARKMQERLAQEIDEIEIETATGGGMVTVKMNGHKKVLSIVISKEVMNPDDPEMLQDMILAALNEASRMVDEELKTRMGGLAGGLGIPGLF